MLATGMNVDPWAYIEFHYAKTLNKRILCTPLEPMPDTGIIPERRRCDLAPGNGPTRVIHAGRCRQPVVFSAGLHGRWTRCAFLWASPSHLATAGDRPRPDRGWEPRDG